MVCEVTLYKHLFDGFSKKFHGTGWKNVQGVPGIEYTYGYNEATSYDAKADENCMIVAYTWHGGGKYRNNGIPTGDIKMLKHGRASLLTKEGQDPKTFNDNFDALQLQRVPSAGANQFSYHINIPTQTPHDMFSPRTVRGEVLDASGRKFTPCPGGTAYFNSRSGIRCIYSKTNDAALRSLYNNRSNFKSNQSSMLSHLQTKFCEIRDNAFKDPGGGACFEKTQGATIAKNYCAVGNRIVSDSNCSKENLMENNWKALSEAYCKTPSGRGNQFCSCYNVLTNVCAAHPTAAGCAKKKQTYDALLEKVPDDQKKFLSGMETCFGGVCAGNKYLPPGFNANCNRTVNICVQDIDIRGMTDSNVQAQCDIESTDSKNGADGAPGATGPSPENGDLLSSLDNTTKIGGLFGILVISCMCMMILFLLASASGKGQGRFRR